MRSISAEDIALVTVRGVLCEDENNELRIRKDLQAEYKPSTNEVVFSVKVNRVTVFKTSNFLRAIEEYNLAIQKYTYDGDIRKLEK